ncbi:MAG TPA: hypothetical protein VF115_01725 [Acidimicrobiia bacterium]
MTALLIIEGFAIILLGVLVVGLLRSHAEIIRSLHQLGAGSDHEASAAESFARPRPRPSLNGAPDLVGQTLEGSTMHVGVSGTDHRTLLAFLSTGCSACVALWQGLSEENPIAGIERTRLVVVAKGAEAESPSRLRDMAPGGFPLIQTTEAWESYAVPVTPYFVLVEGTTGEIVGEGSSKSWAQVRSLIGQALADRDVESQGGDGDEMLADRELRKAGIGPDHPSLYPGKAPEAANEDRR